LATDGEAICLVGMGPGGHDENDGKNFMPGQIIGQEASVFFRAVPDLTR
jgi:hypothetical protein